MSAEELNQNVRGDLRFSVVGSRSYLSPHSQPQFFYKHRADFQTFLIYHYVQVIELKSTTEIRVYKAFIAEFPVHLLSSL